MWRDHRISFCFPKNRITAQTLTHNKGMAGTGTERAERADVGNTEGGFLVKEPGSCNKRVGGRSEEGGKGGRSPQERKRVT